MREYVRRSGEEATFPTTIAAGEEEGIYEKNNGPMGREQDMLTHWADEIERYYIPRPRFEDGEPVKEGDEVYGGTAYYIQVMDDRSWKIEDEDGRCLCDGNLGDRVRRPEPVFDADGVPIKVGDTVWDKRCPQEELVVVEVDDNGKVFCNEWSCYSAEFLTHKEPDSLDKFLNDIEDLVLRAHAEEEVAELSKRFLKMLNQ